MKPRNAMHKYYIIRNVAFVLSSLIVAVPVMFYCTKFYVGTLSNDPAVWGEFGDFMNVWVSLASLIILGALTFYLNALDSYRQDQQTAREISRQKENWDVEQSRQEANRKIEDARNRPYVIYKFDILSHEWKIKNVGIGPALNLKVSFKDSSGNWRVPVKVHSLAAGEETKFPVEKPSINASLCLVYNDIQGTYITTYGENEDSRIVVGENCLEKYKAKDYTSTAQLDQLVKDLNIKN